MCPTVLSHFFILKNRETCVVDRIELRFLKSLGRNKTDQNLSFLKVRDGSSDGFLSPEGKLLHPALIGVVNPEFSIVEIFIESRVEPIMDLLQNDGLVQAQDDRKRRQDL